MVVGGAAGEVCSSGQARAFDEPSSLGVTSVFDERVPSDEALGWHTSGGEDSQFPDVSKCVIKVWR